MHGILEIIQENQSLFAGFFFLLALACMFAAVGFGIKMLRTEQKADQRLKQARADITDMTILFQTMRDIIGQQKALAKDFNEELEHKMEQVKHILHQGMEKNKQLHEKQERIARELEDAQVQLDGLFRQVARTRQAPANGPQAPPAADGAASRTRPEPAPVPRPEVPVRPVETTAARAHQPAAPPAPARPMAHDPEFASAAGRESLLRPSRGAGELGKRTPSTLTPAMEARLADTGVTKAPFTSWVAEDFSRPSRDTSPAPAQHEDDLEPETAPDVPGNGDAAREAFRALLNMPAATPRAMDDPLVALPERDQGSVERSPATDAEDLAVPLQQRVLEYSEAGMTVAQVSRELGIGKGEVRLMLSLAKQQSPPRE